jgi:mannosyltransferase
VERFAAGIVGRQAPAAANPAAANPAKVRAAAHGWITLIPGVVTFLVMLCGITGTSYWTDETATISATMRPLPGLIRMLGRVDAVHGLYYLLMWMVARVAGDSELAFRIPSALGMALAATGIAAIGWRLRTWRAGLLAGLVFPCIPLVSLWGQSARSYPLEVAVAVFASYRLLGVIDHPDRRRLACYAGSIALLGYVNVFGLLLVPAHAITVAAISRAPTWRRWLTAAVTGCVVVVPVMVLGWRERGQIAWIPRPSMSDVQNLVAVLGGGAVLSAVIIAVLAALGSVSAQWPDRRRPDDSLTWLCLPWLVVPPVILLTVSQCSHVHVYGTSYVLYCTPPVVLLAGAGLASLWPPWRFVALGLIVVLVLPAQVAARQPDARGQDIRAVASFLQRNARDSQAVLYTSGTDWDVPDWVLGYPYGFTKLRDIGEQASPAAVNDLFGTPVSRRVLEQRMRQVNQLWVIEMGSDYPPPSIISAGSFRLAGTWQISDIWLRRYDRPPETRHSPQGRRR